MDVAEVNGAIAGVDAAAVSVFAGTAGAAAFSGISFSSSAGFASFLPFADPRLRRAATGTSRDIFSAL